MPHPVELRLNVLGTEAVSLSLPLRSLYCSRAPWCSCLASCYCGNGGPNCSSASRIKAKREDDDADEKAADAPDPTDHTVPIFATGGDFIVPQSSLIHRGQRKFDAHAAAARGALDELKVHFEVDQQWDVNKVDEANEYGPLLAAAARSGSEPTVKYVLSRKPNLSLKGGRYHSVFASRCTLS